MSKNRLDYTANLGRHDHDVTAGFTSSITTGPIVPQYFDILGPGDKIFYKTHMFCRFQHMPTAFLGEVDLHLDYFFVPLQMLYTAFGQVFAQTNDVISDFFDGSDFPTNPDTLPIMDLNSYFETDNNYNFLVSASSPYCRESFLKGTFRLLDSLNISPLVVGAHQYVQSQQLYYDYNFRTFNGFPSALLAYQAIYQKFFRNDEMEKFDISSFNVDTTSMMANKKIPTTQYRRFLTLRYSGRPNDYFTTVRFSPIATSINSLAGSDAQDSGTSGGDVDSFGNLFRKVSNFLGTDGETYAPQGVGSYIGEHDSTANLLQGSVGYGTQDLSGVSYYSAQNIRAVFALDKYMRVYGRAGKTYDDQILAHFGVKVPHDVKHDITHLKHYRMVLQTDPVVSTADTEQGNVGSVGGQLAAQLDTNEESFRAPVHGVFMCVARLIPHPRYFMTNDRLHAISERLSFPIPEFDKLGAQPVYNYEYGLSNNYLPSDTQYLWKNRYSEFKEKYNRCSITYAHDISGLQGVNFFSPWVVSKKPYSHGSVEVQNQVLFSSFFVQPNDLDNVMVTKYQLEFPELETWIPNPHIILQTDPVLTEFACFAKKVSWMSPSGEPDL